MNENSKHFKSMSCKEVVLKAKRRGFIISISQPYTYWADDSQYQHYALGRTEYISRCNTNILVLNNYCFDEYYLHAYLNIQFLTLTDTLNQNKAAKEVTRSDFFDFLHFVCNINSSKENIQSTITWLIIINSHFNNN